MSPTKDDVVAVGAPGSTETYLRLLHYALSALNALVSILVVACTRASPWVGAWWARRSIQKDRGAKLFTPADLMRSLSYYVTPRCSLTDPAEGSFQLESASALYPALDELFSDESTSRYAFLFGDSGIGKTSAVLNYYGRHLKRLRKPFGIHVIPMGLGDADTYIAEIEKREDAVLFLDGLDEDVLTVVDPTERVRQLVAVTRGFRRVLISCRPQLFPAEDQIPVRTGNRIVGPRAAGESAEEEFRRVYLCPFVDAEVRAYVRKRYPFFRPAKRAWASTVIIKIAPLAVRPMLLANIDKILRAKRSMRYGYELYDFLIDEWLHREKGHVEHPERLRSFCERLAVDLYARRAQRGSERIHHAELGRLAREWGISVDDWQLGLRSLLNRDPVGNFKFSHRSILEFLFVKRFLRGEHACMGLDWTELMKSFLREMLQHHVQNEQSIRLQDFGLARGLAIDVVWTTSGNLAFPGSYLQKVCDEGLRLCVKEGADATPAHPFFAVLAAAAVSGLVARQHPGGSVELFLTRQSDVLGGRGDDAVLDLIPVAGYGPPARRRGAQNHLRVVYRRSFMEPGQRIELLDPPAGSPFRGSVAVPMEWGGRCYAILLVHSESGRRYTEEQLRTIREISWRAARSLHQAAFEVRRELDLATQLTIVRNARKQRPNRWVSRIR